MKFLPALASILLFSLPFTASAEEDFVPLSAQAPSKSEMMNTSCQESFSLTQKQCACIAQKGIMGDVSNHHLITYFTKDYGNMPRSTKDKLDVFKGACTGSRVEEGSKSSDFVSKHNQQCLAGSLKLDQARCDCFLQGVSDKKYSDNDIKWFLKGRASKMSEFSLYSDMSKVVWNCESTVVRKEMREKYKKTHGTSGGTKVAKGSGLQPLKNPQRYSANRINSFLKHCPATHLRDSSYCQCLVDSSWKYIRHPEFQVLTAKATMALSSINNLNAKHNFIKRMEKSCAKKFRGKHYSNREADAWAKENGMYGAKIRTYKRINE